MMDRFFDTKERMRQRRFDRDQDERDLAESKISAAILQKRNSLLSGFDLSHAKFEILNHMR